MRKQVLILNVTRMGDLVQTVPLLSRLEREWPGVAIDLVVDTRFAPMAMVLPGLRQVLTYDFHKVLSTPQDHTNRSEALPVELTAWIKTLQAVGYDRVINLTFTRWSGVLASAIGVLDTRGVTVGENGVSVIRNPWLTHVVDLHQYRRFNRFNLVDLYALGGSGPGAFSPITLSIPAQADDRAQQFLATTAPDALPIAVHVGASHPLKAWRPELYGRTMAALSRRLNVAFMLIGTAPETEAVQQAIAAYRQAGGVDTLCDAVGHTTIPQLAALLRHCRLLLTNDTGPMHLAVGVGTPVIDLSVGHAHFHETGPAGPGHWVIQPVLDCAPCGYAQVCAHQACKDQILPEHVAALALHVLGEAPLPSHWSGVQVYESGVDEDGLTCYQQRAGQRDPVADWYGPFWRRYWYDRFTGPGSRMAVDRPAPDIAAQQQLVARLLPAINRTVELADQIAEGSRQQPMPGSVLREVQRELLTLRSRILPLALSSPAFGPPTVVLLRELSQCDTNDVAQVAERQVRAYRRWKTWSCEVMEGLSSAQSKDEVERPLAQSTGSLAEIHS